MSNSYRRTTALLLAAGIASSASVASAMPFADGLALKNAAPATTEQVRWGGRGFGWGFGGGFLAGAVIGGALAPYPYYYGPGPYYYGPGPYAPVYANPGYGPPGGDPTAYCMQRFKSYDPRSGTYLGYDGLRHPCP